MQDLSRFKCVPCSGSEPALDEEQIAQLKPGVPDWNLVHRGGVPHLERVFRFPDFASALHFTNQIGEIAEEEDHHPSLLTEWGRVTATWWTHKIKGLHKNDFIMAAKTDRIYSDIQAQST